MSAEKPSVDKLFTNIEAKTQNPNALDDKTTAEVAEDIERLRQGLIEEKNKEKSDALPAIRQRFAQLKMNIDYSITANGAESADAKRLTYELAKTEEEIKDPAVSPDVPVAETPETEEQPTKPTEAPATAKKEGTMLAEFTGEMTAEFAAASLKWSQAKSGSEKFTIVLETLGNVTSKVMAVLGKIFEAVKDKLSGMGASSLKSIMTFSKFFTLPAIATDLLGNISLSEKALLIDGLKSTGKYMLVPDKSEGGKEKDKSALSALQAKYADYKKEKEPKPTATPTPAPTATPAATPPATPTPTPNPTPSFEVFMKEVVMRKVEGNKWEDTKKDAKGLVNLTLSEIVQAMNK